MGQEPPDEYAVQLQETFLRGQQGNQAGSANLRAFGRDRARCVFALLKALVHVLQHLAGPRTEAHSRTNRGFEGLDSFPRPRQVSKKTHCFARGRWMLPCVERWCR